jgi:Ca-activated chloride channel family protein
MLVSFLSAQALAAGFLIPEGEYRSPLDVTYHCVHADISDRHAQTHVEQVFYNPTDRTLEAMFIFPVPRDTTINEFAMRMNGERVTGELVESEEACEIYESIVYRVCDPGLLEFVGGRLLKARVFPIPPRGSQKIDLTYSGLLPLDSEMIHYEYPLRTEGRASQVRKDFSITVRLGSEKPLAGIYSPSHPIEVEREGDRAARVTFERSGAFLDEDFDLYFGLCEEPVDMTLMTHRLEGEDGFFLLLIAPITGAAEETAASPDVTFVLDISASMMEDDKIGQAKRALQEGLRGLEPENRFNIVRFNDEVESFRDGLVPASPNTVDEANAYVGGLDPRGQTDILAALLVALRDQIQADRHHVIVFLTDGKPTIGETSRNAMVHTIRRANRLGSRIFAFGLGDDVDTHLLDQLSQENHGVSEYLKPRAEIETRLSAFYRRIRHPVLSDPELTLKGVKTYDVYPERIMDIFAGQEVSLVGRFKRKGYADIRLRGDMEGKATEFRLETIFPEVESGNDFLPRLWGGRKIAHLLDRIRLDGETPRRKSEVMALSKEYGIMTPYTSYLITEDDTARVASQRRPSADPLDLGGIFSTRFLTGSVLNGRRSGEGFEDYGMTVEKAWKIETGGDAVAFAKKLRELKETKTIDAAQTGVRIVNGRTFLLQEGAWVEQGFNQVRNAKVVSVKFLSRAYFDLLRMDRSLGPFLALGEEVIVKCAGGFLRISESDGAEQVPRETLQQLLKG